MCKYFYNLTLKFKHKHVQIKKLFRELEKKNKVLDFNK